MADLPPDREPSTGTPLWVKVFGIVILVLVLLVVVALVTGVGAPGGHGPGRHAPSGDGFDDTSIGQEVEPDGPAGHTPPIQHGP